MRGGRTNGGAMIVLVVVSLLSVNTPSIAQVQNVDHNIQDVYRHFMRRSLSKAVKEWQPQRSQFPNSLDNVIVQFNGGGLDNRLYIGRKNTLQIWITTQDSLAGLSLGLSFTCYAGSFSWVEGYGAFPLPGQTPQQVLFRHSAIPSEFTETTKMTEFPDSLLLGCIDSSGEQATPPYPNPVLIYSMQIEIPAGTSPMEDGFSIDNIFYPPAGYWILTEKTPQTVSVVPDFQGIPNTDDTSANAPPVYFDIVESPCYSIRSGSRNAGESARSSEPQGVSYEDFPGLRRSTSGEILLRAHLQFFGDERELKAAGCEIHWFRMKDNWINVTFPLRNLPGISLVKGVERIAAPATGEMKLDYAAPTVQGIHRH